MTENSVHKPLATAHTGGAISPTRHKAISVIIGYSYFFDPNFRSDTKYYLPLEALYGALGWSGTKDETWIKKDIGEWLRTHPIEWNTLNRDKEVDWQRTSVLSSVGLETIDGTRYFTFHLSQLFAKHLRASKLWIIYKLANISRLKKVSSIRLFEYLGPQFDESGSDVFIQTDTLDDVRVILGKENVFEEYKILNRSVLKPSVEEINKVTEIYVEYEGIRKGRSIEKIRWTVRKNKNFDNNSKFFQLALFDESKLPFGVEISDKVIHLNKTQQVIEQLTVHHVSKKKAGELVDQFGVESCEFQLQNLAAELKQPSTKSGIQNPAAWLVKAIEEDYGKSAALVKQEKTRKFVDKQNNRKERERWKQRWLKFREERGERKAKAASEAELASYKKEFIDVIASWKSDQPRIPGVKGRTDILQYTLNKEGETSPLVNSEFKFWLKYHLLDEPEEMDLDVYIQCEGDKKRDG